MLLPSRISLQNWIFVFPIMAGTTFFVLKPSVCGLTSLSIRQQLERDVAPELRVARTIDLAHPTGPERGDDLIRAESSSGRTVSELRGLHLLALEHEFGRYGVRLYELARGVDESEVIPDRPTQSISVEDTFEHDVPLSETEPTIRRLAEKL